MTSLTALQGNPPVIIPIGVALIDEFCLLTTDKKGRIITTQLKDHSFDDGIIILHGINKEETCGHAMMLQIDRELHLFLLYDNNRDFYRWSDFDDYLGAIQCRLQDAKWDICEYFIPAKTL